MSGSWRDDDGGQDKLTEGRAGTPPQLPASPPD